MPFFSGLESVLERFVEGGFRRAFAPQLQPADVTRALERVMVEQRSVGPSAVTVPGRYVARLHPTDYERLTALGGVVERDAAAFLDRRALEHGFEPSRRIQVTLIPDDTVRRSSMRSEGTFDVEADIEPIAVLEPTRSFPPVETPRAPTALIVTAEDGNELRVIDRTVSIGRGSGNDLVIRDLRVSRRHVSIESADHGWVVRDLGSTNGTYLGGQRVADAVVDEPVELILGGYRLTLRPD